jgi:hypothetical protein
VDVSLRRLAGQDRYRVERRTLDRRGDLAIAEHTMLLLIATGEARHKEIARGEALDPELPWIFEQGADSANPCRLIRQGSGAIAGFEGILCIPQDWDLRPDDGASVDCKLASYRRHSKGMDDPRWHSDRCLRRICTTG